MNNKKAQLFSLDGLTSMFICIIMVLFILAMWNLYSLRLNENITAEEMQLFAFQITDLMINYEGMPSNWHNDPLNASVIGLQDENRGLHEKKLNTLMTMNYTRVKQLLNIERFEYFMEVYDDNGNLLNSSGSSPENQTVEGQVAALRFSTIGNAARQIRLTLWR